MQLTFPGWQPQPLSSVQFPEAKALSSGVAALERSFWGSIPNTHTSKCTSGEGRERLADPGGDNGSRPLPLGDRMLHPVP